MPFDPLIEFAVRSIVWSCTTGVALNRRSVPTAAHHEQIGDASTGAATKPMTETHLRQQKAVESG